MVTRRDLLLPDITCTEVWPHQLKHTLGMSAYTFVVAVLLL